MFIESSQLKLIYLLNKIFWVEECHITGLRNISGFLIVLAYTFEKLTEFKNLINRIENKIMVTMESIKSQLPFLNILIIKRDRIIETNINCKHANSKHHLLFSSCYFKHTENNILFNLANRISISES